VIFGFHRITHAELIQTIEHRCVQTLSVRNNAESVRQAIKTVRNAAIYLTVAAEDIAIPRDWREHQLGAAQEFRLAAPAAHLCGTRGRTGQPRLDRRGQRARPPEEPYTPLAAARRQVTDVPA